ncbi:MAG: Mu transposase C-terminal domain-containing protein [Cycloclasticus sp.]
MLISIEKGTEFSLSGKSYVIEVVHSSLENKQVRFRDIKNGDEVTKPMEDFLSLHESGGLVFTKQSAGTGDQDIVNDAHRWILKSDAQKKIIRRKKGYIAAATGPDGYLISGTLELKRIINTHARQTDDYIQPPSVSTVKRWFTRLSIRKGDDVSLLRRQRTEKVVLGEHGEELSFKNKAEELFDACVREYYLKPENKALAVVEDKMKQKVKEDPYFESVVMPHASTLYRWLTAMSEYEKHKLKKGYLDAQRNFPNGHIRQHPTYLLESVELDHTPLDVTVVDPEAGEPIENPWLTLMIDRKSRMVVGFYIAMHTPNIESVIYTFRNAVLSKSYVKEKYGDKIKSAWPCYGVMDQIITDNGPELHADDVKDALSRYVDVQYNKKGTPQHKGTVERMFRTLNEGLIHGMKGTTFNSYKTKSNEYNSADEAVWSLEGLIEAVHIWIIDIYHNTIHSGIKTSPLNYWNSQQHTFQARTVVNIDEIDQLLWKPDNRKIQKYGIQINNLVYQSPELMNLAKQHGMKLRVDLQWDKNDLSLIKVIDPCSKKLIDVHCTEQRYVAERLDLSTHNKIRVKLAQDHKSLKGLTESTKLAARERIEQMELEEKESKNKAVRKASSKKRSTNSVDVTGTQVSPISGNAKGERNVDQDSGFEGATALELEIKQEEK